MKVLIIEAQIKQYRFPFYQKLFAGLRKANINLQVGYSDPPSTETSKKDACDLPTEYGVKVKARWFLGERVVFQPLFRPAMEADLVIVDQGNKYLLNHVLLPLSRLGLRRVAFWGLAENRQDGQLPISEWYRRNTLNWASWWFAYTEGTARYLEGKGVPSSKITIVNNAVDTSEIHNQIEEISQQSRAELRKRLGIPVTAPVGIFCGMLDKVKGLGFLLEAAKLIQARLPEFHLLVLGSGPEQARIEAAVEGLTWVHMTGSRFGKEKSELMAISDAFLMPGRVGLVTLDAFASGLPLLTIRLSIHGPEIEYLKEGVNGLMAEPTVPAFVDNVVSLFANQHLLSRLRSGARASGERYTIENMAANFQSGIEASLGLSTPGALAAQNV